MAELRKRWDIACVLVLFLLAAVAERGEWFQALEAETISFRHLQRMAEGALPFPDDAIVFVNQDEGFFEDYGSWPLRRVDLAQAAVNLSELGARVVAVDNLFDFPSSYDEDAPAARRFERAGKVLVVSQGVVEDGRMVDINYPVEPIRSATRSGYTNIQSSSRLVENMSRIRIFPEATTLADGWPFAVQAVAMYLDAPPSYEDGVLRFGDELVVPFGPNDELRLDFPASAIGGEGAGYAEEYGLSVLDFLDLENATAAERDELRAWVDGRIVLFGDISEVSHDYFETPIGRIYGVEIIATTIATLLSQGMLQPAGPVTELVLLLAMLAGLVGIGFLQQPGRRALAALGLLVAWAVLATWLYVGAGVVVSMAYVFVAFVLGFLLVNLRFYLVERGQKTLIRDAFGQYLSPKVVNILVKDPSRLSLGGERREMTAYFSDIASFSTISEQLTPDELVALLNEYLTAMCDIIASYDGTVDKFEGDAIIAFWGAPLEQPDHARLACLASLDMQEYMRGYRERLKQQGRPLLNVRMGLNTGDMLVGNLGSAQRMDYTMMGDSVNLAARLEGANKFYGTQTMISEFTYAQVADDVEVRELDLVRVVGKRNAVRIYELLARRGGLDERAQAILERYDRALATYREGNFEAAIAGFEQVLELDPEDGPAQTYIERCRLYIETPPPADWDGVFEFTSKG